MPPDASSNRVTLDAIRSMPIGEIAALPAPMLALIQDDAEEAVKAARTLADWLNGAIALRYGERACAARRAEGKDTGTIRLDDGEVTVIADLPKKIDWDQAELTTLVAAIRAEDGDPTEYVDTIIRRARAQVRRLAAPHPHRVRAGAHGEDRQAHVSADAPGGALKGGRRGSPHREVGQALLRRPVNPRRPSLDLNPNHRNPHGPSNHQRRRTSLGRLEQDLARHLRPARHRQDHLLRTLPEDDTVLPRPRSRHEVGPGLEGRERPGAQLRRLPRSRGADRRRRTRRRTQASYYSAPHLEHVRGLYATAASRRSSPRSRSSSSTRSPT